MKPSASKRRRGVAIMASLALAAGGVAWAGCGDDEEDAADAAQEIQDRVDEELDDANVDEQTQEAIDDAQEKADEAIDDVDQALEEGDVEGAIDEAQEEAEQAAEDAGY